MTISEKVPRDGDTMVKLPSARVVARNGVLRMNTVAPTIGRSVSASRTVPRTASRTWAPSGALARKTASAAPVTTQRRKPAAIAAAKL